MKWTATACSKLSTFLWKAIIGRRRCHMGIWMMRLWRSPTRGDMRRVELTQNAFPVAPSATGSDVAGLASRIVALDLHEPHKVYFIAESVWNRKQIRRVSVCHGK